MARECPGAAECHRARRHQDDGFRPESADGRALGNIGPPFSGRRTREYRDHGRCRACAYHRSTSRNQLGCQRSKRSRGATRAAENNIAIQNAAARNSRSRIAKAPVDRTNRPGDERPIRGSERRVIGSLAPYGSSSGLMRRLQSDCAPGARQIYEVSRPAVN